ncbi:MAG: hypothetical protein ACRDQH_00730, partial [Pseudonocardiaceae bacterium]
TYSVSTIRQEKLHDRDSTLAMPIPHRLPVKVELEIAQHPHGESGPGAAGRGRLGSLAAIG